MAFRCFFHTRPVAACLLNFDYVRTNQKWSRTTSKHINQWLEGVKARTVEQSYLDELLEV